MANLKELRTRINSVKSTRKITKAMQMVAASKLRRAQDQAQAARPYAERLSRVISNLSASLKDNPGAPELLVGNGKDDTHLVVVATGDRGLAGGFNSNIARAARNHIESLLASGKSVKILHVGRKGYDVLKRLYPTMIIDMIDMKEVRNVGYSHAHEIGQRVLKMFAAGEVDVVSLFYSEFVNVITQNPTQVQLIPAQVADAGDGPDLGGATYIYEPDEEEILRDLLPRNVSIQIFRALLENAAGFQGAQMTAMDNATRNAGEMIDKLTLDYNRSRQAQITKELIEIISGAEAL